MDQLILLVSVLQEFITCSFGLTIAQVALVQLSYGLTRTFALLFNQQPTKVTSHTMPHPLIHKTNQAKLQAAHEKSQRHYAKYISLINCLQCNVPDWATN
jgi:hypothetical protein